MSQREVANVTTSKLPQARACTGILATAVNTRTRCTRAHSLTQPEAWLSRAAVYCGPAPLAKKRVKMLRAEKTTAALLSLGGASSWADTFCPLIRPPRRFWMPAR